MQNSVKKFLAITLLAVFLFAGNVNAALVGAGLSYKGISLGGLFESANIDSKGWVALGSLAAAVSLLYDYNNLYNEWYDRQPAEYRAKNNKGFANFVMDYLIKFKGEPGTKVIALVSLVTVLFNAKKVLTST